MSVAYAMTRIPHWCQVAAWIMVMEFRRLEVAKNCKRQTRKGWFEWDLWLTSLNIAKKELALGGPYEWEKIWGWGKTIQRWTVLHILCGISTFDKAPISGRDVVRTPTRLLLQSGSMPLQLSYLADWTLLIFLKYNTLIWPYKIDHDCHVQWKCAFDAM